MTKRVQKPVLSQFIPDSIGKEEKPGVRLGVGGGAGMEGRHNNIKELRPSKRRYVSLNKIIKKIRTDLLAWVPQHLPADLIRS